MVLFPRFTVLFSLLFALLGAPVSRAEVSSGARQEMPLTTEWRFRLGDLALAEASGFNDAGWESITLPHTWNARDGQDGGGDYYRGDGWYRRHFRIDQSWAGTQIFLQFDGANRTAEVFLNGRSVGSHRGGFARFRFDVTAALDFTGDNVLAVRVSNRAGDNMIPVSAATRFSAGSIAGSV